MKRALSIFYDMVNSGSDSPKDDIQEYETALGAYKLHILSGVSVTNAFFLMDKYRRSIKNDGSFLLADEAMNGISLLLARSTCQSLLDMPLSDYRKLVITAADQEMRNTLVDVESAES